MRDDYNVWIVVHSVCVNGQWRWAMIKRIERTKSRVAIIAAAPFPADSSCLFISFRNYCLSHQKAQVTDLAAGLIRHRASREMTTRSVARLQPDWGRLWWLPWWRQRNNTSFSDHGTIWFNMNVPCLLQLDHIRLSASQVNVIVVQRGAQED